MRCFSDKSPITRRLFLLCTSAAALTAAFGCKKGYRRVGAIHKLGEPKDLLYSSQIVRDQNMLVLRDRDGWATMSAECTKDGCALSFEAKAFVCPCCSSVYSHEGAVLKGPSSDRLPFFKMSYSEGSLYADSSVTVAQDERFTTEELEQAISQMSERIRQEGARAGASIPEILMGQGDKEPGKMFIEEVPPKAPE